MPLIKVNAVRGEPVVDGDLAGALASLPDGAPVVVLIHGFKYRPGDPLRCPHLHILSLEARKRARVVSWPRHLGFGRGDAGEGLCIAFGWHGTGSLWRAHAEAARAGRALASLIREIGRHRAAPVHLVGHSLGARVALAAFDGLPEHAIGRAILLAAAETRACAERALATPAGRTAEFVNVRSFENTLFDVLLRAAIFPHRPDLRALGAGLGRRDPRWRDLAIDCPETRAHLGAMGFRIPPPARRVCHWSAYLRPGLFPLYRALLRQDLPLAALQSAQAAASAASKAGGVDSPGPLLTAMKTALLSPGRIVARAYHMVLEPSWVSRPSGSRRQPSA